MMRQIVLWTKTVPEELICCVFNHARIRYKKSFDIANGTYASSEYINHISHLRLTIDKQSIIVDYSRRLGIPFFYTT